MSISGSRCILSEHPDDGYRESFVGRVAEVVLGNIQSGAFLSRQRLSEQA